MMFKLIKGYFKILIFDIDKLGDEITRRLEEIANIERKDLKINTLLKGYKLGYKFETVERMCDVAFKMGYDVNSLFMGLFRQEPRLLDSCGLSKKDIDTAIYNIDGMNYYNTSFVTINKEDYAKAILDYLEAKNQLEMGINRIKKEMW